MSYAGKKIKHNNLFLNSWLPHQKNLIRVIKTYPITYHASSKNKTKLNKRILDSIWEEIASKLGQSVKKCKRQWTNIKFKYAKIMILINTGKITKEVAMSHPETHRFFDGLLSFLDPHIYKITDDDIPVVIHKSINELYGLKTSSVKVSHIEDNCHFVTHAQVISLLAERQLSGDVMNSIQMENLQAAVNIAVQNKLGKLMKNTSSNSKNDNVNIDDEDTVNVTMMPNKNLQIVRKGKATSALNPSENILNKDEENRTKSINLELQSEFIIEDDIKSEKEDNIKIEEEDYVNIKDEDIVKEENFTLEKIINNTVDGNFSMENSLPRSQIITPVVHDVENNTLRGLNENAIITEDNTDEMMDNAPPVTDEYMRNFFAELGVIMSMELPFHRQKILQSRINELLKSNLLKES